MDLVIKEFRAKISSKMFRNKFIVKFMIELNYNIFQCNQVNSQFSIS